MRRDWRWNGCGFALKSEHRDVVILSKCNSNLSDGFRAGIADGKRAVKAEKFAGCVARLDHAIGKKSEGLAGGQGELRLLVIGAGVDAERQARSDGDFGALAIRCEISGIGDGHEAICRDESGAAGAQQSYAQRYRSLSVATELAQRRTLFPRNSPAKLTCLAGPAQPPA
jgi:hypothetical protein